LQNILFLNIPIWIKILVYGRIANFINLKVIGQKAKEIREEKGIEPSELTTRFFYKRGVR